MKMEIVAIGDEVLQGNVVNSNAAFISGRVLEKGCLVQRHSVVSDAPEELKKGVEEAFNHSDLVIATGGLGPNLDDRTKKAIASLFGVKLIHEHEIEQDLNNRFGLLSTEKEQSTIFEGSHYFLNRVGTAPGIVLEKEGKVLILLPGVPPELYEMFEDVLLWIEKRFQLKEHFYQEKVYLALLPEPLIDSYLRELTQLGDEVQIGIYPSAGFLQVHFSSKEIKRIQPLKKNLCEKFSSYVFEHSSIEEAVHEAFLKNGKTLAFAESCSGGAMAAHLTSLSDASKYFLGSVVSYSNEMKQKILGVSKKTLDVHGAVSKETVTEMIEGVFKNTEADYAVAVSGVAGPSGGTDEKPVGTVFIGICERGKDKDIGVVHAQVPRSLVITYTVNVALAALWRWLVFQERTFEK